MQLYTQETTNRVYIYVSPIIYYLSKLRMLSFYVETCAGIYRFIHWRLIANSIRRLRISVTNLIIDTIVVYLTRPYHYVKGDLES